MTVEIAIELWRSMKEYVPVKERFLAAHQFVNTMIDFDFSDNDIHSLEEVDQYMESAVKEIMGEMEEDDDEDDYPDYEGDD
jgi:hypothetical protein